MVKKIVLLFLIPSLAYSYDFVPTDPEWDAWPDYCKARYVSLPIGKTSKWTAAVSQLRIDLYRKTLGEDLFAGIQHYCAGKVWIQRAIFEQDKSHKAFMYRTAISEMDFTYKRLDALYPLVSQMLIGLAQANEGLERKDEADGFYRKAIELFETDGSTYVSYALFLRKNGELQQAKKVLLSGNEMTNGQDMDINMLLAHVLLVMGEGRDSVKYAKKGYLLGYPLPALREKLIDKGLWNED